MFASQSERFSRKKNDPYICEELINHAYKYGEPELICWYEQPFKKKLRQIRAGQGPFRGAPRSSYQSREHPWAP